MAASRPYIRVLFDLLWHCLAWQFSSQTLIFGQHLSRSSPEMSKRSRTGSRTWLANTDTTTRCLHCLLDIHHPRLSSLDGYSIVTCPDCQRMPLTTMYRCAHCKYTVPQRYKCRMIAHVTNMHPPIIAAPASPPAGESSDNDAKIPASSPCTSPASDPMEGGITSFDDCGECGEFQLDGQYLQANTESTDGTNLKERDVCGN